MKINVPYADSYILITEDLKAPDHVSRWSPQSLLVKPITKTSQYSYQRDAKPIDLKAGEWYKVKNIRGTSGHLIVDLALETKSKERPWAKAKVPEGFKLVRHYFRVRLEDLNLKAECFDTLSALKVRLGILEYLDDKAKQGRFSKIGDEQTT